VALELERELEAGLRKGARAVVLRSRKPGSFVNGVGLLLAASSHSRGAALDRASTLRRCYERLAAAPVPTIAAIEGNCYGCGLELALTCDYRIAHDSYDTHFYMPELRDYAFIPLFGGTQRLPRLLGVRAGMEVLLGERVDARRASRIGLVDRLAPMGGIDGELRTMLAGLRSRGWPKRSPLAPARTASPSLEALPGPERTLASECLELARLPSDAGYRIEEGLEKELASFWSSLATRESERAMSFFFTRQGAKAHAIGSAAYARPRRLKLAFAEENTSLRALARILRRRPLPGISVGRRGAIAFAARKVRGAFTCTLGARDGGGDCAAFLPFPDLALPPIEIVPRARALPWRRGAALFQVLEQAGFVPVVTLARDGFVSRRLIAAFRREVAKGAAPEALLDFGYRLPPYLLRRMKGGAAGEDVAQRVSLALARECVEALDGGELTHPSQADLLAHALFGFPVVHGGLLRYAASTSSEVAAAARRVLGR
jgi:enoyl-CoA hydratase/carnithine racemase